ncbi:hypothetical protein H072_2229 [Dactylellina haptotyla CBS 200.50]|uniref:Uncharacterized protein n=1 Tax=Dactylellina haptotyla (strain CBS 200.50) TaxID=1284197 RepID=S8BWB7_DACHA|nr:hypothetical protein H072_2229 [Dactylellina haptotyla CBS 200.50]
MPFPFPDGTPQAALKQDHDVTFDPLAVAAILYNPRADLSAAKLYLQLDRDVFSWPHTMMIGGTLPPMNTLVAHLSTGITSIHPAITMCTKDVKLIPVRSDMIFQELPVNLSNYRVNDLIEFRSSQQSGNDFMVVNVDDLNKPSEFKRIKSLPGRLALTLIGAVTGLLLIAGVVFGILTADIWAATLFFFYASHWLASTFISFAHMVRTDVKGAIAADNSPRYAVYQRPEGGTVVFKGKKETLERWARETLEFNKTPSAIFCHWFWMVSGTMAAISSVACMVNMRGYMQLGFLGVLLYSSVAEILATQLARHIQTATKGSVDHSMVGDNATRTTGIIRATVEVPSNCRLKGLDWIKLKLLPDWPVYQEMLDMLARINEIQDKEATELDGPDGEAEVEKVIAGFLTKTAADTHPGLNDRIANETRAAWRASRKPVPQRTAEINNGKSDGGSGSHV